MDKRRQNSDELKNELLYNYNAQCIIALIEGVVILCPIVFLL